MKEILFDRNLLRLNIARAEKDFANHNFLYIEVANRILENLEFLNREFENVLEIGAKGDYLNSKIKAKKVTNIEDVESLPFAENSFDLIISNLNFHFINQIPQFLLDVKKSLKPGGVFIASFFGEENLSELNHVLYEVENEIYGGISPRMPPTIDVKTSAHLLQKGGFANPVSDLEKIIVEYSNPHQLLKDLKIMGQGNILVKRNRKFFTKNFLNKILQKYRELYLLENKKVKATFEIITITGIK